MDQARLDVIRAHPIGNGLEPFRNKFESLCKDAGVPCVPETLERLNFKDVQVLLVTLFSTVIGLVAAGILQSTSGRGRGSLRTDLLRLLSSLALNDAVTIIDFHRYKSLVELALDDGADDVLIWSQVYRVIVEPTPPPTAAASSVTQTPWVYKTSSFANSSEHREQLDDILKRELGTMIAGIPDFHEKYFGGVARIDKVAESFVEQCTAGNDALFNTESGWQGWPRDAEQQQALRWITDLIGKLEVFAEGLDDFVTYRRRVLARPNHAVAGSVGERKLDIGFVDDEKVEAKSQTKPHWSQILVPGELKSNPAADRPSEAWLDLGRYAREVLSAQDTRRFVLGFTLCGSLMRTWAFDRLGAIGSARFDIHKDAVRFIQTLLGFLCFDRQQLGFDPTIQISQDQKRYIDIRRGDAIERIYIDGVMHRTRCITGRATTCWKAHRQGQPTVALVVKDSWQYPEREEEGELLREAAEQGVVNVARYYHHETVQVGGADDDILANVRGGIDVTKADNYPRRGSRTPTTGPSRARGGGSSSSRGSGRKRSSSHAKDASSSQPRKRSRRAGSVDPMSNRIHRRVIIRDYGKPIYNASSPVALVAALEACITGHESLHKAGLLHRDISINNLMINEDANNASWPGFLIDLDLAISRSRQSSSGAQSKTGTLAFMAIGALLGEEHNFSHDLESFFWVLFWICVHHEDSHRHRIVDFFKPWNYENTKNLALIKMGMIAHEEAFSDIMNEHFTEFYQVLKPLIVELRGVLFPGGKKRVGADDGLYGLMRGVLSEAREALAKHLVNGRIKEMAQDGEAMGKHLCAKT